MNGRLRDARQKVGSAGAKGSRKQGGRSREWGRNLLPCRSSGMQMEEREKEEGGKE